MEVKLLTSPQFRHEVQESFKELSDQEMQMKEWMNPNSPHPYWDHLKFCVLDTIYNMHDLDEKCYEYIGEIFYDEEEAKAVQDFCIFFSSFFMTQVNALQTQLICSTHNGLKFGKKPKKYMI